MIKNEFVTYLNTLHNYYAQNSNVFGEKNINNDFYKDIMVEIPLCNFVVNQLTSKPSHIIVLTGHAGDGKTSLMYQVLNTLNQNFETNLKKFEIQLPNGKKCLCIKDFSEFSEEDKILVMQEVARKHDEGNYVFMVANTGPLINSFPTVFSEELYESVQTKLINLLDENTGEIENLNGLNLCVINVVALNNTFFAKGFVNKIINSSSWNKCNSCDKKSYCPVLRNISLIKDNKEKVIEFISNHYKWISEYGERLTIRSMTQQLSYMITGGLNCEDVVDEQSHVYLSSNLFFGYKGTRNDNRALAIGAIKLAQKCNYDKKRFRVDENLFISRNYKSLFTDNIIKIIEDSNQNVGQTVGWQQMIKRMYMFYNIQTNDELIKADMEDIFSNQFNRYIELKYLGKSTESNDSLLIKNALSMLNLGSIENNKDIPITLNRESGYVQNVQYVVGTIKKNKIKLITKPSIHSVYLGNENYSDLYIKINGVELSKTIDLPLLDYFEDLKNGIINTNIDAQLSKGIENLKSEILSIVKVDEEEDSISLIVSTNSGFDDICFNISDGTLSLE